MRASIAACCGLCPRPMQGRDVALALLCGCRLGQAPTWVTMQGRG